MPLAIASVFAAGLSVASAAVIQPGMTDNFDNGDTAGWTNGRRVSADGDAVDVPNVKNGYLEVRSCGASCVDSDGDPITINKRLVVFNETQDFGAGYESPWAGDYSKIKTISADVMATSSEVSNLNLRLAFISKNDAGKKTFFVSKDPFKLKTDGQWQKMAIDLASENFLASPKGHKTKKFKPVEDSVFTNALTNLDGLKFLSSATPRYSSGDKPEDETIIAATLGIDNITASGDVSNVPLPGAAWLMISGLMGLGGISVNKRKQAA